MKKTRWTLALLASVSLALVACNKEEEVKEDPTPVVEDVEKDVEISQEDAVDELSITFTEGNFLEMAGEESATLAIAGAAETFLLSKEMKDVFSELKTDAELLFGYTEDDKEQKTIVSVEVSEEKKDEAEKGADVEMNTEEWVFIGVMDSHSVEFEKDGKSVVAQYDEHLYTVMNTLEEGGKVTVEYFVNDFDQVVLNKVLKQ